jgi:hypothetical protein
VDIDMEESYGEYLMNMIRNRLKSIDGDYGVAYKYNIYKNIGTKNSKDLEKAIKQSVFNMLTFDDLVKTNTLDVAAMKEGHKMIIGIKVSDARVSAKGFLDMVITRVENGKTQ